MVSPDNGTKVFGLPPEASVRSKRSTAPSATPFPTSFEHRRQLVSTQRFTPELKEEAVKQVVERVTLSQS